MRPSAAAQLGLSLGKRFVGVALEKRRHQRTHDQIDVLGWMLHSKSRASLSSKFIRRERFVG